MIGALFGSFGRVGRAAGAAAKEQKLGQFLSRSFGGSTIKQRALIGGGFFGAASLVGSYYDAVERQLSAYYGEEKYQELYASGIQGKSSLIQFGLNFQGFMGLLGRDPISKTRNTFRYLTGSKNKLMQVGTKTKYVPQETSFKYKYKLSAKTGKMEPAGLVPHSTKVTRSYSPIMAPDPKYRGHFKDTPRLGLGSLAFGAGAALAAFGSLDASPYSLLAAGSAVSLGLSTRAAGKRLTKMTVGVKNDPARAMEFGLVGGAGTLAEKNFIRKRLAMTGLIMGGGFTLGAHHALTNNSTLAEGNIIDFSRHNESGVSRMNFSTAGLVQALHRSNSSY